MATTNLGMPTIPENSLQPGVAVNSALVTLDAAVAGTVSLTMGDANYTLLPADYQASVLVIGGTLTAGRDVVFPAAFPSMLVTNNTGQTLTLKKTGQTGTALAAATSARVSSGVTDVLADAAGGGGGAVSSVNGATGAVVLTLSGLASVQTVTSAGTVTPVATNDKVVVSAQAAAILFDNPTGTEAEGQGFVIALKDNGTARAITWGANYRAMGAALPTTTTISKWMYIPVIYNGTDDKWDVMIVSQQA